MNFKYPFSLEQLKSLKAVEIQTKKLNNSKDGMQISIFLNNKLYSQWRELPLQKRKWKQSSQLWTLLK